MATEDLNITEDAEMAECDGDKVVTMMDVLQEQQDFEEDANAVLGASDDKNCTYSKGYVKRQALYACITCCPEAKDDDSKRAGVCLACSLACHENHELVELYTKRNFRCDCGNPKFNSHPCSFTPNKTDLNEDNIYNQNFSGLYCVCQRPYPDPEATFEDDMIQCIVCEDWLHASHLDATVPSIEYAEMICKACMEKNDFLHDYIELAVNFEPGNIDIVSVNGADDSLCNRDVSKTTNGDVETPEKLLDETVTEPKGDETDKKDDSINDESKDENVREASEAPTEGMVNESSSQMDVDGEAAENQKESKLIEEPEALEMNSSESKDDNTDADNRSEIIPDQAKAVENDKNDDDKESKTEENNLTSENQPAEEESQVSEDKIESKVDEKSAEPDSEPSEALPPKEAEKENKEITSDPVMDAIDELLASEPKETKPDDEKQENESTDIKENTTESADVEMNNTKNMAAENKEDDSTTVTNGTTSQNGTLTSENNSVSAKAAETGTSINETNVDKETKFDNGLTPDENSKPVIDEPTNGETLTNGTNDDNASKECKRKMSTDLSEDMSPKKAKLSSECVRPKGVKSKHKGATFWTSTFRQKLCMCGECISMYKDLNVLFLTDLEDTVFAYESLGKDNVDSGSSQYEKGLQALSSLDRVQQINALTEYNKMRDKLLDFLKSFKEKKEIVKEDDIKEFFANMKPKREPDGVYFCR